MRVDGLRLPSGGVTPPPSGSMRHLLFRSVRFGPGLGGDSLVCRCAPMVLVCAVMAEPPCAWGVGLVRGRRP